MIYWEDDKMRMIKMKRRHYLLTKLSEKIINFGIHSIKSSRIIDLGLRLNIYVASKYNMGDEFTIMDKYIMERV